MVAWWGEPPSLPEVEAEYGDSEVLHPYLAYSDARPIGFIQLYTVKSGDPDWWPDETDPGARGTDQFLADPADLGTGLGTQMLRAFVDHVFEDPAVTKLQTDPSPDNGRAIRCYEKVGFRRVAEVVTPDGPALLMVIHRAR